MSRLTEIVCKNFGDCIGDIEWDDQPQISMESECIVIHGVCSNCGRHYKEIWTKSHYEDKNRNRVIDDEDFV